MLYLDGERVPGKQYGYHKKCFHSYTSKWVLNRIKTFRTKHTVLGNSDMIPTTSKPFVSLYTYPNTNLRRRCLASLGYA